MDKSELREVQKEFENNPNYKIPLNKFIEAVEKGYINPHYHFEYDGISNFNSGVSKW